MERGERRQRGEECAEREIIQNRQKMTEESKHRGVCETTEKTESNVFDAKGFRFLKRMLCHVRDRAVIIRGGRVGLLL